MKKFAIAMVVIIIIGILLSVIGCAVLFTSDISPEKVEYIEKYFETEEAVSSLSLNLENSHKVVLQRGEKCSVKYYDSNVTSFSVNAENGKLNISESGWKWDNWLKRLFYKLQTTEVVITVPEGAVLDISGSISGSVETTLPSWEYGNIGLDVRGAANIIANDITAGNITLDISGAANLSLSGKADKLKTEASGSVNIRCDSLECPSIDVRASGSANINLSGTGKELTFHASGSGKLWAKDFALERADIDASGSVKAELNVSTYLKVNTSGSSHITYWGDPQVDKSTSGSSKIEKR